MEALAGLEASAPAQWLRGGRWSYALVSALHIMGIAALFGAILPLDLKRLGLWPRAPEGPLSRVLPQAAASGLALAALTGFALFATRATEYAANPAFLAKLALVALGAANAVALHLTARAGRRRIAAAALLSLALWAGAIVAGRMIAFV